MKKQLISIILMLTILMSTFAIHTAATEAVVLTVSEATANPGREVAVTVSVSNNPGLASLKFDVAYDSVLTLTNVTFNSEFGAYVTAPEPYRNPEPITMIAPLEDNTANGVFVTLTFKVAENAEGGHKAQINITYSAEDVFDGGYNDVPVSVVNGSVTVVCPHEDTVNVPEIPAGPDTVGYTAGVYCNDCSKFISGHVEIPATGDLNAPKIVVDDKTVTAGQTFTIELTAENFPNVKSLMLENFTYDGTLFEFVSAELNLKNALIADWNSSEMIATVAFGDNTDINGVIMTLTFKAKENITGECSVGCDVYANQIQTSGSETPVEVFVVAGTVAVVTYQRGDVNGDGYVNSNDAIYLLRHTLSSSRYPINQGGDFNGDGYVNSNDAIYLLRHTLSPSRYPLHE